MRVARPCVAPVFLYCLTFGSIFSSVRSAHAFCRATTCDPELERCPLDAKGCPSVGLALYWPSLCMTFAVHQEGSALRGISASSAEATFSRAFQAWLSADCGNGRLPSFGIVPFGQTQCDRAEFAYVLAGTGSASNANILIFRDEAWPYEGADLEIARTTLTFDVKTGAIYDADIEVNSVESLLSTTPGPTSEDLQTVLTHEAGHFLGLAHSADPDATMYAEYPLNDLGFRTLSLDDAQGICSVYPPVDQQLPEASESSAAVQCPGSTYPLQGFSTRCIDDQMPTQLNGCSIHPDTPRKQAPGVLLLLGILVARFGSKARLTRPNAA